MVGPDGGTKLVAEVGVDTYFTIEARNKKGARRRVGGDDFTVSIRGFSAVEDDVHDNGDGTYTVKYNVVGAHTDRTGRLLPRRSLVDVLSTRSTLTFPALPLRLAAGPLGRLQNHCDARRAADPRQAAAGHAVQAEGEAGE